MNDLRKFDLGKSASLITEIVLSSWGSEILFQYIQWCNENFIDLYDESYLFYKHPVHEFKNKLFRANNNEISEFMKERIIPDEGTGSATYQANHIPFSLRTTC